MQKKFLRRLLSGILAAAVAVNGLIVTTPADDGGSGSLSLKKVSNSNVSAGLSAKNTYTGTKETPAYGSNDVVRVSIVLKDKSTIEAGFDVKDIADNDAAMNYREGLKVKQEKVALEIEKVTKKDLDVVWNVTLAANLISANVKYGDIEKIEELPEVDEVVIETRYSPDVVTQPIATDPNMSTSSKQIGSDLAWAAGYTGAGSRIAIIDTGADYKHQSFNGDALMYSLKELAEASDDPDFIANLKLMTADEIEGVKDKLNVKIEDEDVDPEQAYLNAKIPFAVNYVDLNYTTDHAEDTQGEHGSHVAGISTANKYIAKEDGTYEKALDSVFVQGVAPDAQLLVMKVFGANGGAYDSDYMVAIEDAIILKADSVNLSLGSGNAGTSRNSNETYQAILDSLTESGVVVAMSAGNSGAWADNTPYGDLYADGVNFQTDGSPGSYTNSLAVASIDNAGMTANYFTVNGEKFLYTETSYSNKPFTTLADMGELEYVFIDGFGTEEDWAAIGDELEGKVAVCQRGGISFYQKGNFAVEAGAVAIILYNNQAGTINMDLSDYSYEAPFVSITQEQGALMKAAAVPTEAAAQSEEVLLPEGENAPSQEEETASADEDAVSDEDVNEEAEEAEEANEDAEAAPEESEEASEEENEAAQEEPADAGEDDAQADDEPYVYYVGSVTAAKAPTTIEDDSEYYTMSDFSSWGVPGSLELKPEITAPGGNIYSVNGYHTEDGEKFLGGSDAYENMSGTSMASPQIAGMAAVAAQYIREKGLVEKTGVNARILIQSLLMSTAEPVVAGKDAYGDKLYYSVMNQGAGLANIGAVLNADSYILMGEDATLSKAYADGKVKAELGDDPYMGGVYTFSFSINNLTDKAKTYRLSADMFTQAIEDVYFLSKDTINLGVDATFDTGKNVEVPANGSVTVNVTLEIDSASLKMLRSSYENGAYIEGYVYAKSAADDEGNAGTTHSIPVLGYFGNWTDPSMFDLGSFIEYNIAGTEGRYPYLATAYDDPLDSTFANAIIVNDADSGDQVYFGGNPYIPDEDYMPERNAINGSDSIIVSFAAVRNAADSLFEIGIGNLYANMSTGPVTAAYYYANGGSWMAIGSSFDPGVAYGDFGAEDGDEVYALFGLAPEYYVDSEGNTDWGSVGAGAFKYVDMIVDNEEPEATDCVIDEDNNVLKITASDNHYIAAVALYNSSGAILYDATGAKADIAEGAEAVYELSLDEVTYNKGFYIQVYDYAMNTATYFLDAEIGELDLPEMIAFNLDASIWAALDKESTMYDMLDIYADSMGHDYYAATIVDHMVFASDSNGVLYVMPEYDLTNVTKVGDLVLELYGTTIPITLTDMAYSPYYDRMFGVGSGALFIVDPYTADLTLVGFMPFDTITLACDDKGYFYCNEAGTSDVYRILPVVDEEYNIIGPELIARVDMPESDYYVQAMEVNPNTGMICWTSFGAEENAYYVEIDPNGGAVYDFNGDDMANFEDAQALLDYRTGVIEAIINGEYADFDESGLIDTYDAYLYFKQMGGKSEVYNDLLFEMAALIIPELHEDGKCETTIFKPMNVVLSVELSQDSIGLIEGGSKQLEALVKPWNASNKAVIWSSDDEDVATVNQNGVVTAVSAGECTITATSAFDSSIKAECEVTVKKLAATITGVIQDEEGQPSTFEWNFETDDTWTSKLPLRTSITSATLDPNGYIYIMDGTSAWAMHKINAATGEQEAVAPGTGYCPYWDMAYSTVFSTASAPKLAGIFSSYLFIDQDPMAVTTWGYNLSTYLSRRGASYLVGLASMGASEVYDEDDDYVYDTECYAAVDNTGAIWYLQVADFGDGPELGWLYYYGSCGIDEAFKGYDNDMYCSLIAGADGNLFFSVFDQKADTNKIYYISVTETADGFSFEASLAGNVGKAVWPAALLTAVPNRAAANASAAPSESAVFANGAKVKVHSKVQKVEEKPVQAEIAVDNEPVKLALEPVGEEAVLYSVSRSVDASVGARDGEDESGTEVTEGKNESETEVIEEGTESFELDITAKDEDLQELDTTNGLVIVSYDPEVITLTDVISNAEYHSENINTETGIAILAYVNPDEAIPGGEAIDTLVFTIEDPEKFENTVVNIAFAEFGNGLEEDEDGEVVGKHVNVLQNSGNGDIMPADIANDREVLDQVIESLPRVDTEVEVEPNQPDEPDEPDEPDPTPGGNVIITPPSTGSSVLEDEDSGVKVEIGSGTFDEGTELVVDETGKDDNSVSLDISIKVNGVEVQPNGTVTVTIPVPEGMDGNDCHVYRVEADGTYTDMNAVYANGMLTFTTDRLGEFVVSTVKPGTTDPVETKPEESKPAESKPAESEPTGTKAPDVSVGGDGNNGNDPGNVGGDTIPGTGVVIAVIPAAISALAVVASKKRRK